MLPARDIDIEKIFPDIYRFGYKITSPKTCLYNCIGWAADDNTNWWWPDIYEEYYWPKDVCREETIEAFIQAYGTIGYKVCSSYEHEDGFVKIVIYTNSLNIPTHAARESAENNMWLSKLGKSFDIMHHINGLDGDIYGKPSVYMKKSID